MMMRLKWNKCNERFEYHTSVLIYKCVNNLVPNYLDNIFKINSEVHSHNTRNCKNLHINKTGNDSGMRKFGYRGSVIWNRIPTEIKDSNSLGTFKTQYKRSLLK